ncbi:hypothetical protein [Aquabacter cavernae]|uniref:hypothetical protein n=1 Tax=Aquabacter cavernae TaxID=2496029 RepID=UPI000F8D2E39|nr:hypothetical protein [Aquabacter cavernae]
MLNDANLIYNRSGTYAFTGAVAGTGFVTFTGGGTVLSSDLARLQVNDTGQNAFTAPVSLKF